MANTPKATTATRPAIFKTVVMTNWPNGGERVATCADGSSFGFSEGTLGDVTAFLGLGWIFGLASIPLALMSKVSVSDSLKVHVIPSYDQYRLRIEQRDDVKNLKRDQAHRIWQLRWLLDTSANITAFKRRTGSGAKIQSEDD